MQSNLIIKYMKRILICIFISLFLFACSKDDKEESEYYIKYHFVGKSNSHYWVIFDIEYTNQQLHTDKKEYGDRYTVWHGNSSYEDEITCGPFKYNDNVTLSLHNLHKVYFRLLEIYVSKDNSPFVLKKTSQSSSNSAYSSISYTIDF